MGAIQALLSNQTSATGVVQSYLTANEIALMKATDLLAFFDAKGWSAEAGASGRLAKWSSRKANAGVRPTLSCAGAPTDTQGGYIGTVPSGTRTELRIGLDSTNTAISGNNNKLYNGSTDFVLPNNSSWTMAMRCRVPTPGSTTYLIATADTSIQLAIGVISTGAVRFYADYSNSPISSTAGDIDTASHLLVFRYDLPTTTLTILKDGVAIKIQTGVTLPTYSNNQIQLGTVKEGASVASGSGFALEAFILTNSSSTTTVTLFTTVLAERAA